MKGIKIKDIRPIEGFKVMEWVRSVREKQYELYKNNPEEYYRQLKKAGERMKERFGES
jgi:hypothetical protein